jgi:hypothetical protein
VKSGECRYKTLIERSGVSHEAVRKIVYLGAIPKLETARRLAAATGGAVSVREILRLTDEDLQPTGTD